MAIKKRSAKEKKAFSRKNFIWRIFFFVLIALPVTFYRDVYHHFSFYLSGSNIIRIIRDEWYTTILSIAFFISFLIPLSFRRKINWTEYGLVFAFFVSLFVEMYGIPFTLLFVSKLFNSQIPLTKHIFTFKLLGIGFGFDVCMAYGFFIMAVGMVLIFAGWITLYRNIKRSGLVTVGIYAYSRHPQYLGFILIILGWGFGWPTIMTVVLSLTLVYKYVKVCLAEEEEVIEEFPEYREYKERVPFLL